MAGNTPSMSDTSENIMSRRGFLQVVGAAALSGATASAAALTIGQNNVLSPELKKEVAKFAKDHPEWASEFMPFEQDCIAGIEKDAKECEEGVRGQLEVFRKEISLRERRAQVNARETQVNARETQVNARETQVELSLEMVNRISIVVAAGAVNNLIKGIKNAPREGILVLNQIKIPVLQPDINYIQGLDKILMEGGRLTPEQVKRLQEILLGQAQEALRIYTQLPQKIKNESQSSFEIASNAHKLSLKQ